MNIFNIIGIAIALPSLAVLALALKNHYQQQQMDRKRLEMKRRKMDAWKKSRRAKRWV